MKKPPKPGVPFIIRAPLPINGRAAALPALPAVFRPQGHVVQARTASKMPVVPPVFRPQPALAPKPGIPPLQAKKLAPAPVKPGGMRQVVQRMIVNPAMGFGSGGGGSGGDDDKRRWHPDDKVRGMLRVPRTPRGGKHFIPANWIDRLLALAVHNAGNLGRVRQLMSDMQDVFGDEAPLEISFYDYTSHTQKPGSHYISMDNKGENGFMQVFGNMRDELREWPENVFPQSIESTGDQFGKTLDVPTLSSSSIELRTRLTYSAAQLVLFFDKWCGYGTVSIPLEDGETVLTWRELKRLILIGMGTLIEQGIDET